MPNRCSDHYSSVSKKEEGGLIRMKEKRFLAVILGVMLLITAFGGNFSSNALQAKAAPKTIDNSDLLPKLVPDSEVTVDSNGTPDWVKTLIIGELVPQYATKEGTLDAAIKVLDHYAEMGVNGIWIAPVYESGSQDLPNEYSNEDFPNGYSNLGPETIDPRITGTKNYEAGWKKLAWFIEEAHKRNIRVILDVISWGVNKDSPLIAEHPEWFSYTNTTGTNYYFNWNNDSFVEYYISTVVNIAVTTGCDGFRYDTEPSYAGYEVDGEIRERLWKLGKKPFMMSEDENDRGTAYDIGQSGMTEGVSIDTYKAGSPIYFYLDKYNIVDSIKNGLYYGTQASQDMGEGGSYHYYTFCIANHDYTHTVVNGNRAVVGYQAMFTPFIPVMLLGEEFNNPHHHDHPTNNALYFNSIDWTLLENKENSKLFEDIKEMIRIRRSYPEIFAYYPDKFSDSNICKVNVTNCEVVQPYARYADNKAIIVVPNYNIHDKEAKMTVYTPFSQTGLDYYKNYKITDLSTGEVIVSGSASKVAKFTVSVPYENQRLFLVEATEKLDSSEINNNTSEDDSYIENDSYTENDSNAEIDSDGEDDKIVYEEVLVKKKKKKSTEDTLPIWPFIVGGTAVILGGGITVFLIKKKKTQ